MPDYNLNWTVLYKGVKGANNAAHPSEGGLAKARGPFNLKYAISCNVVLMSQA